jgi:succinate-semialdehyde dehydrogenase/glutarate-semialdehyde dehydrogenase
VIATAVREAQLYLGCEWVDGATVLPLTHKFTGAQVANVQTPSHEQLDDALRMLADAQTRSSWSPYERYEVLSEASRLLAAHREEAAQTILLDTGFTITDARREVDRGVQTLLLSAEEAKRLNGETVPMSGAPGAGDRLAFTVLHPIGVVCAITPFNSPLNTVLHKVGPALAAGNAVVLKPAALTPLSSELIVRLLLDAGTPPGLIALVHGSGSTVGQWLLESEVPNFYAFTGSTRVGEHIMKTIGVRRSQLELGSLSSTIVCDDAELEGCVPLCLNAAFRKSGQVCTSVQRLYVQKGVLDAVASLLTNGLRSRKTGDPSDEETFVGPLISTAEAERVASWIEEAAEVGADIIVGGERVRGVVAPTVLHGVSRDVRVMSEEVFGPVVVLRPFTELDEAIAEANATAYGLAAGIFTHDIDRALDAARRLRMGSVHINETSSSRVDLMPYGGVKRSGLGREGPHWAVREMSEERLITIGPTR